MSRAYNLLVRLGNLLPSLLKGLTLCLWRAQIEQFSESSSGRYTVVFDPEAYYWFACPCIDKAQSAEDVNTFN